ncbi:DNA polymerase domain-containing protein [Kytococcus sp. Marseille-QA3725]
MSSKAVVLEVPGPDDSVRTVRLSSPGRVMCPAGEQPGSVDVTKRNLAEYLLAAGSRFLQANADRPVTLQRFPTGIDGEEFYSKNPPKGAPDYLCTTTCTYPSGRSHDQVVLDEVAAAVWAVQMSTLTFHPWPVRTTDHSGDLLNDCPDQVRLDLDPMPGRPFTDVVTVARTARELLGECSLTGYVKTSGHRGLHVFAPIEPDREFLDVRHGVIALARELERRLPELVTTRWWKEERGDKCFIDFNQHCRDRTLAGAWSPRALPGAPVSLPVTWDELDDLTPGEVVVPTAAERLQEPDPWADMLDHRGDFSRVMQLWEADLERGLGEEPFPPDHPKMPGEPPRVQPSRARSGS